MSGLLLAGRSVLIVEDDYLIAASLAAMLEDEGAQVIGPVGNVHDALGALDPQPDVATLDVKLGRETSFPIADELARREVPFVFATGTGVMVPPKHQQRPLCLKPVSRNAILKALVDAIGLQRDG